MRRKLNEVKSGKKRSQGIRGKAVLVIFDKGPVEFYFH